MSMSVDKTDDKMMLKLLTNNANHVSNFLILLSDCVHFEKHYMTTSSSGPSQ